MATAPSVARSPKCNGRATRSGLSLLPVSNPPEHAHNVVKRGRTCWANLPKEVETSPMETLLKCTQASNHLIELVDRVIERHPHKGKSRFRRKLFSWLRRDLVRPSLNRPSQKL